MGSRQTITTTCCLLLQLLVHRVVACLLLISVLSAQAASATGDLQHIVRTKANGRQGDDKLSHLKHTVDLMP